MQLFVCGGRDFNHPEFVYDQLDQARQWFEELRNQQVDKLIVGDAKGADSCAAAWARFREIAVDVYEADWKRHGRRAGPIRNRKMVELLDPKTDAAVVFPGGRGTADSTSLLKKREILMIPITERYYREWMARNPWYVEMLQAEKERQIKIKGI